MKVSKARDLMVPINHYPIVDSSATVLDAVIRLEESRSNSEPGRQPYQAVLVTNQEGRLVGKLGQLALLRGLEPRSHVADNRDTLKRAGVGEALMKTAFDHFRTLQLGLPEMCLGASSLPVRFVMIPFKEHIDVDTPICEVVHKILEWQTLSVLVTQDDRPVGLVRLSDLCDEVMKQIRQTATDADGED